MIFGSFNISFSSELNSVECIIPLIETVHVKDAIASIINQLALFDIKPLVTIIKDDEDSYELVICPDFMLDKINEDDDNYKIICVPSHANVSSDPIERAISRYSIILDNI